MELKNDELNLIYKLAWSFYKTTRLNFNDLFQEAALAYCKSKNRHIEGESKVTTYCYKSMMNRLIDFARKEKNYYKHLSDSEIPEGVTYTYLEIRPINSLVKMIIENREKFEGLKPRRARGEIRKLLRQKGCNNYQVEKNMKKLEISLTEMVV